MMIAADRWIHQILDVATCVASRSRIGRGSSLRAQENLLGDPRYRRPVKSPIDAAVRVGSQRGFATDTPVLVQETNNTVVWLRPHAVIAKVGTHSHSAESLTLEHGVSAALATEGAPIAPPVENVGPVVDAETTLLVTLWHRLDHDKRDVSVEETAGVLALLHEHLERYKGAVPHFKEELDRARRALADDALMAALPADDRSMLRAAYDRYRTDLDACDYAEQTLHGEPHDGNLLATPNGPRWIDLEGVCLGPLEWDLAFLDEDAASLFPRVDHELLALLRVLNSARVATWCWSRPEHPEMRWHAEFHLDRVKQDVAWRDDRGVG